MILEAVTDTNLKVYVVWTAVLQEDEREAAINAIGHVSDERADHFWDADQSLGLGLAKVVTLPGEWELAWDVYLAFDKQAKWHEVPPKPSDWMHQLGNDERRLDGVKLRTLMETLLSTAK